jgi:hypothetical protein
MSNTEDEQTSSQVSTPIQIFVNGKKIGWTEFPTFTKSPKFTDNVSEDLMTPQERSKLRNMERAIKHHRVPAYVTEFGWEPKLHPEAPYVVVMTMFESTRALFEVEERGRTRGEATAKARREMARRLIERAS